MSKLILAMIAMAGFGVAAAQAPAPKQNEVGSVTQRAFDAAAELVVNVFRSAAKRL